DVVVGAHDDQVAALAFDDLGADQEHADAVGGEEVHGGKINDDLSLFRDDLVEWQLDDDCPRRIETPLQNDFGNAAGEIFRRDVHAAPVRRATRVRVGCHSRIRFAAECRNPSRSEDFRTIHTVVGPAAVSAAAARHRRRLAVPFCSAIPIRRGGRRAGNLPQCSRSHSGIDRNSAVTDNRPMGAGPRILVVDDNDDNRYTLTLHLDLEGYTDVETARDGEEAIARLETSAFDLVLLDVMMPKVDGFQVLTWLKDQARLRDLPVIMISALTEMNSMARCIELGAVDYLLKPFNPVLLKARLGATLEKKRLRDEVDAHLARLQEELDAARRLQMAMVPQSFPP